jgi:hypothetical protein
MTKIKISCPFGTTLEVDGDDARNQSKDFISAHSDCLKFSEFKLGETIDNVSDIENVLREAITEPLQCIANSLDRCSEQLSNIEMGIRLNK